MLQSTEAVVLGAAANFALAALNALALRMVMDKSKPLEVNTPYPRASLVPTMVRSIYLPAFFASISLVYREEIVTTALGVTLAAGIAGYLALIGLQHALVRELRGLSPLTNIFAVAGVLAYGYAIFPKGGI